MLVYAQEGGACVIYLIHLLLQLMLIL